MFESSHFYSRFPEELESNRLDVLYNDTLFDELYSRITSAAFEFVPLSEVADFLTDTRNPRETPLEEFLYVDIGSIDTIRGTTSPQLMLGQDAVSSRMRRVINSGNVLVSTTRPTRNAICIVPDELDDQICSTGLAVLKSKPDVLTKFLFYALRSGYATLQFERLCSGSGYPAINQEKDLPQLLVPRPETTVQQAILETLSFSENKAIRLDDETVRLRGIVSDILLNELGLVTRVPSLPNYVIKTGAEKQTLWFHVLPHEISDRLHYLFYHPRHGILNELSDLFRTVNLDTACGEPIFRGDQPIYDDNGTKLVLKTVDLRNDYIDYDNALRVSEDFFNSRPATHVQRGDIIVAATGFVSMGKIDVYELDEPAMISGELLAIRVNEGYDPYFLCYYLRSYLGQIQFDKWFSGASGQIHLYEPDLAHFQIPSNSVQGGITRPEQERIANTITEHLRQVRTLEQEALSAWAATREIFEQMTLPV